MKKIINPTTPIRNIALLAAVFVSTLSVAGCGEKAATTINMEAPMSSQEDVDAYAAQQAQAMRDQK